MKNTFMLTVLVLFPLVVYCQAGVESEYTLEPLIFLIAILATCLCASFCVNAFKGKKEMPILYWGLGLFGLVIVYVFNSKENKYSNVKNTETTVQTESNGESIENETIEQKIGKKIANRTFHYSGGGLNTSINFSPNDEQYNSSYGSATLHQLGCNFVYAYTTKGTRITMDYVGSDCGRPSTSTAVNYNFSGDYVSMFINGQQFIFR